jgi:malonyl-ACP O-methyltransferase BioC
MKAEINKSIVEQRFRKSMPTYEKTAVAQQQMAINLVNMVMNHYGKQFAQVLEIGTGTGLLTKRIVETLTFDCLYANDIVEESEAYMKQIKSCINFIHGDIETIKLPDSLDLIISNASLQWVTDLPKLVSDMHRSLNPGGILAFTTFGPDNYREIAQIANTKLNYASRNDLITIFSPLFDVVESKEERMSLSFDSPLAVLKHVKQSGTNSIRVKNWKRKDLENFEKRYLELFQNCSRVELTYHPYFFLLKKV